MFLCTEIRLTQIVAGRNDRIKLSQIAIIVTLVGISFCQLSQLTLVIISINCSITHDYVIIQEVIEVHSGQEFSKFCNIWKHSDVGNTASDYMGIVSYSSSSLPCKMSHNIVYSNIIPDMMNLIGSGAYLLQQPGWQISRTHLQKPN